ncbi:MAG: Gfo/Idh/MocA family oxidoreductase [Planctomycetota bacterium]|jgi:predicted dehydrogenase
MGKQVTLALVGAGSRGAESYSPHVMDCDFDVRFTAVAEPREEYRERAIENFKIPRESAFTTWEELVAQPRLADGVILTTQDSMHAEPAQALMRKGYHVMLEKPMATTEADCRAIIKTRQEAGVMLAVCHVMRYSDHAQKVKSLIENGLIGDITAIHHIEPVGYWHIAHSYVRGNWRREEEACPMLMAKSCHDLDILRYWVDAPCLRVSSFGGLGHFRAECRPEGAADRCLDCPSLIESGCPYSAVKIYLRDRRGEAGWPNNVLTMDTSPEGITEALRTGPYGRCVYACDNDVVDRQVVNMEFEGGVTASFSMVGFTVAQERETWIMGTRGQLRSDARRVLEHTDFLTDRTVDLGVSEEGDATLATGHAGDRTIVLNFIQAIAEDNPELLISSPEVSLESHLMAFAAETARKNHTVETIQL